MLKKKAQGFIQSRLIKILLTLFVFVLLISVTTLIAQKAEPATAEATCRLTLAAQKKTEVSVKDPLVGIKVGEFKPLPKICPVIDVKEKIESPNQIYKYMAKCKAMYGYFLIDDIFKGDSYSKHNCRTCFILTTGKSDKFPKEGIPEIDIITEMAKKEYKVFSAYDDYCKREGGFCADSLSECAGDMEFDDKDNTECKKKGKKGCCWSRFSCINKGGKCEETNPDPKEEEYIKYENPQWRCPSKTDCYLHKDNYNSYLGYIQGYRGKGAAVVLTPIKANEIYYISYGEPNEKCKTCEDAGLFAGLTAAGGTLAAIGLSATGVGLIVTVVGVGVGLGTKEIFEVSASTNLLKEIIQKREYHVIYLTTPEQARQAESCNVEE